MRKMHIGPPNLHCLVRTACRLLERPFAIRVGSCNVPAAGTHQQVVKVQRVVGLQLHVVLPKRLQEQRQLGRPAEVQCFQRACSSTTTTVALILDVEDSARQNKPGAPRVGRRGGIASGDLYNSELAARQ